jgi:hypothetical protein
MAGMDLLGVAYEDVIMPTQLSNNKKKYDQFYALSLIFKDGRNAYTVRWSL